MPLLRMSVCMRASETLRTITVPPLAEVHTSDIPDGHAYHLNWMREMTILYIHAVFFAMQFSFQTMQFHFNERLLVKFFTHYTNHVSCDLKKYVDQRQMFKFNTFNVTFYQ